MRSSCLTVLALLVLTLTVECASAVALRPNKITDGSVCDLGPDTNVVLGKKMLVPYVAAHKDQVDAFFRLGATFVAEHCADGEVLILQGASDIAVDGESLSAVANSACSVADVKRTNSTGTRMGDEYPAFELRCLISKHAALKQRLDQLEQTDPMEALKGRLAAAVTSAERGTTGHGASSPHDKPDCGRITTSTVLVGGSPGCKPPGP
jgi:hypothetical protein